METRTSAAARLAAVSAIVVALLALVVVLAVGGSGGGDDSPAIHHSGSHARKHAAKHLSEAKSYVVKTGDTLTSIAHRTGVTVSEIIALNPEVDPQILRAGETLKLK